MSRRVRWPNAAATGEPPWKVLPLAASLEGELIGLDDAERAEFLAGYSIPEPGLERLIKAGQRLLDLVSFFTIKGTEVRAWTVRVGTQAPHAAGVIHTDFERGFIRAEVAAYEDFTQCNGEQGAREAGKLRLEGKDYVMHDGDVVHFRFNV